MASNSNTFFVVYKSVIVLFITSFFITTPICASESRSYFDELRRLSERKQTADQFDGFSFSQTKTHLQEVLHDILGVSQQVSGDDHVLDETYNNVGVKKLLLVLKEYVDNSNVTSTCINDTGRYITSLISGDSWATQFFDATGKPGPSITRGWLNFVGNYDQCRSAIAPPLSNKMNDPGFKGNYCTLKFNVPVFNTWVPAELGACFPSTCSSTEITELMMEIASSANVSSHWIGGSECLEGKTEVTTATVFAIIIVSITCFCALLGTLYDILFVQRKTISSSGHTEVKKESDSGLNAHNHSNDQLQDGVIAHDETSSLLPKVVDKDITYSPVRNVLARVLLAFSLYSNGKKVLDASQQPGSLSSVHGIRFLSISWVVLGHCYAFLSFSSFNYVLKSKSFMERWTFDAITNALVSVDTFFALSGLLTSYLTIKELKRKGLCINWPMFYFHRFWRLTPPYMFVLVFFLGFQQYFGEGPFWKNEQPVDKTNCEKNWWANLLYVNNLVNPKEMCFGLSWYLANDMQFFVVSPLMLIPFYFHWVFGFASCFVFLLVSWITTGVLSAHYHWGTTVLVGFADSTHWFFYYYITPWCRIGPYVVGIMAGYILSETKGKPFRMRWWVVLVGWIAAIASALAIVYGIHGDVDGKHPSSESAAAFYNAVARSVWGACVCWVIIACSAGYGGPVQAILSWSPFVVLGRLTYMTYLIHVPLISIFAGNFGMPFYINDMIMIVFFLGILAFSLLAAFVFMLIFESPMIGLEKAFLRKNKQV